MATIYGLRTKDASARITLDTSSTPIRSLKMLQVTCDGSFEQVFSIPEIKSDSFVVVDRLVPTSTPATNWSPQAWYSAGQLTIRRGFNETWQVLILSSGGTPFATSGQYGIRSLNNNFQSQIDSVNRVLNVMYRGSFTFPAWRNRDQPYLNGYDFPVPITTYERPLIFVNGPGHLMLQNIRVEGGPGRWTGWRVSQYAHPDFGDIWLEAMQVDWFVGSYSASPVPVGAYGATVSDASAVDIFTSTNNIVQLNSQPATNSFVVAGSPIVGAGYYAASCQMPWTNNYADYFLANAVLSPTYVPGAGSANPWRATIAGFLNGRRDMLQAYTENDSGINPVDPNGRTLFAARPTL
ncbi:hypothetical protein ACF8LH_13070 [Pseudomonas sp. zbq_4]|uniref:hypothetical protein n=1 Tax=Pseudomonas sp. zbq_4 TaxID=3367240 RepID=UPI00370AE4E6